jgi:zinc protease
MRSALLRAAFLLLWTAGTFACQRNGQAGASGASGAQVSVEFEKYELPNGLDVILHVDRSDPVAAVAMTFHVGSAREVPGRTGFAHLFEHLFFLDSENLGFGGLDRLMNRVGSSTNGSTNRDRTNYFEVVPRDALEKALWAESDKLGFFINTVTEAVVAKEKQVVKNEKRQGVDNQPYGHVEYVIDKALYPDGHPYNWQVIGSLEDLDAASLADVKEFHSRWYGPNNATLVVAGDIDVAQTRAWIEKYFGEIAQRPAPEVTKPAPVQLAATRRLAHEDNFARLPQLTLAWPTVQIYHPDSYALNVLARLLTDGKRTPFYEVIVKETQLAPAVFGLNDSDELMGRFTLQIRAHEGKDLDTVLTAVNRAFARFEERGVPADELERVKAGYEASFYGNLSSVLGKAFQLAQYNIFAPSPDYLSEDLRRLLAVTEADVRRVYEQYIKGKPYIATSFVPRGAAPLALEQSEQASVVEEPIVAGEGEFIPPQRGEVARTPSSFDRSVEPLFGPPPTLRAPSVAIDSLANGLRIFAIEDDEIPLVQFELRMKGGLLLEDANRVGVANLLAETMTEGTARRTAEELEQAIDLLGANIDVSSGPESFTVRGSTLARNFAQTMALVEEILLEPRWDPKEFDLAKQRVKNTLRQRSANPVALAQDAFSRLVYQDHILARNPFGQLETIDGITIADLQDYYQRALSPSVAAFHAAGAVSMADVRNALQDLATRWAAKPIAFPDAPQWSDKRAGLYFLDVPDAKQSVLTVGYLAMPQTDAEFYPAEVMNFRLGGGGFASDLVQVLREQKGYTYGVSSGFNGSDLPGPFMVFSGVRSNATLESLQLVRSLMEQHGRTFGAEDLEATKSFLLKNNALAFETLGAKLGILRDMSSMGFPADYVLQREAIVRDMTVERVRELANRHLDPEKMVWLVVGDARTQRDRLRALGLGAPIPVDREGRRMDEPRGRSARDQDGRP